MNGQLFEPTAAEERAGETDTAERCDDPTPRGVIRAALEAAIESGPFGADLPPVTFIGPSSMRNWPQLPASSPVRVLDVGAGYGAWSSEMRRLAQAQGWPVHITGLEIHPDREKHGRKWCDEWLACDWRDGVCAVHDSDDGQVDLVIGNPPFDELTGPKGGKRPPELCMPAALLEVAPAVLLLHTQQAFLKSAAGRASWRHTPPAASWLVPGGVGFRGPGQGADSRCYQVTLWLRGHTGPCSVYMLDDLPSAARQWTVPPGTEQPSVCPACGPLVAASQLDGSGAVVGDCEVCNGTGLDPSGDLPSAPGYQP